jgi:peptidoglycan L-alanyl-D-glutamate endopeptidase CwlK
MFRFSQRSINNLAGVHPELVKVVHRALELTEIDFAVIEGLRTPARQRALYQSGASKTMKSRHLTGHAVDLAPYVDGTLRWDWPLFHHLAAAMKEAATELHVPLVWGGDWKSFPDGPHFELSREVYP